MEIINEGNKNKVECYDCGLRLRFSPQDVRRESIPPQGLDEYDWDEQFTIECPSCNSIIDVTSKITSAIGKKILELKQQREHKDYDL